MKKDNLYIFTYSYPFGQGEQFIEAELKILSEKFRNITIIPKCKSSNERKLPTEKIKIITPEMYSSVKIKLKLSDYLLILKFFFNEVMASSNRWAYVKKSRYYLAYLKTALINAYKLNSVLKPSSRSANYTYWFDEVTLYLCMLKDKKLLEQVITRAHGGDIYEYQHNDKGFFFPFRNYQVKKIDRICPVSADGASHLINAFKGCKTKVQVHRLGTEDFGIASVNNTNNFVLLSCSTFYSYKRIPLLISALSNCKSKLTWVHIGDEGDEREISLRNAEKLPANIRFDWRGQLDHQSLISFYKTTPVSLFINVSASEGLPVTLMEAISFGIPVIAPNVGGISELVTEATGILINKEIPAVELAALIDRIIEHKVTLPVRPSVRNFWEKNYSEKNFEKFSEEVLCAV